MDANPPEEFLNICPTSINAQEFFDAQSLSAPSRPRTQSLSASSLDTQPRIFVLPCSPSPSSQCRPRTQSLATTCPRPLIIAPRPSSSSTQDRLRTQSFTNSSIHQQLLIVRPNSPVPQSGPQGVQQIRPRTFSDGSHPILVRTIDGQQRRVIQILSRPQQSQVQQVQPADSNDVGR